MAGGITLLAAECVAPPLLRAGLWPVRPFAEQPLVTLGDQLPFHWRELKQLQCRHLATFGLSEDACNPRVRESFAELVEQSLLVNGLALLHRILDDGSPLIEAGLLDPDGLKAAVTELETGLTVRTSRAWVRCSSRTRSKRWAWSYAATCGTWACRRTGGWLGPGEAQAATRADVATIAAAMPDLAGAA